MYIDSRSHFLGKVDMEHIDFVRTELFVHRLQRLQLAFFFFPSIINLPRSHEAFNTTRMFEYS